ncbi:MAG: RluA family pseudouridine synthase [Candidatus Eisenbacteria bacterium]|nr:RluA family pseudouridine synthase [Candidatus Eisenbacteria bacterium]
MVDSSKDADDAGRSPEGAHPERARPDAIRAWVRSGRTLVDPLRAGVRLDLFLARRFTYRSRTQWGRIIREGRVTVNHGRVRPSRVLRAGDSIEYVPLSRPEPPIDREIAILHADADLVAVAKSGNLPLHPSGRYFRHTLLHLLQSERPEWERLRVIHRLDRETSGVVVFGLSRAAAARVARQFHDRKVEKRYLALVWGEPAEERFTIDLPLGRARESLIRKAVGVREDGIPARTEVRLLHRGDGWAWVEARPLTGRLHQIRVHLKAAGLPIMGDKVYGPSERLFLKFVAGEAFTASEQAALGMERQALHAYRLRIAHPRTGEACVFTAPLPRDLCAALAARGLDPARALPPEDEPPTAAPLA